MLKIPTVCFAWFVRITYSHGQFPLAKFWRKLLANCQVIFATSHLWCSLPWWIHCPLVFSVAKESQRSFYLCSARRENSCEERFPSSRTTQSSFIRKSANFGNVVSPFSSRGKKKSNIFSELIHPLLKLPNCVLKQQQHILQLSEALGSVFSLFKELALSAYCHFHSFLIFQKFRSQVQTKVTRAILSRNQSAGVSNLQRGRSCE